MSYNTKDLRDDIKNSSLLDKSVSLRLEQVFAKLDTLIVYEIEFIKSFSYMNCDVKIIKARPTEHGRIENENNYASFGKTINGIVVFLIESNVWVTVKKTDLQFIIVKSEVKI